MIDRTEMMEQPGAVLLETLPDGRKRAVLRQNIARERRVNDTGEYTVWTADEVSFGLPAGSTETAGSIMENLDAWWEYGAAWTGRDQTPTLEERVAAVEAFAAALLEGGLL